MRVIGLRVGARFAKAVEIEPAPARKRRRLDELQDRGAAFFHRADRLRAGETHHGRVHIGGRVEAVDRDLAALELLGEIDREQNLRELALAIGPDPAIATGCLLYTSDAADE